MSTDVYLWPRIPTRMREAIEDVAQEYVDAKVKHGAHTLDGEDVTNEERLAALGEEFGEVCRALTYDHRDSDLRAELIQTANVALTWASTLERRAQ